MAMFDDSVAITAHLGYVFRHIDELGMSQRVLGHTNVMPSKESRKKKGGSSNKDAGNELAVPRSTATEGGGASPHSYDITLSFGASYFADTAADHARSERSRMEKQKLKRRGRVIRKRTARAGPEPSRTPMGWDEQLIDDDTAGSESDDGAAVGFYPETYTLSERASHNASVFTPQPVPPAHKRTRPSALTVLRMRGPQTSVENPFSKYYELSGEGQMDDLVSRIRVFFPFCRLASDAGYFSTDVIVLRKASVQDVIGLAMYLYTDARKTPALRPDPDQYVLRMVEDDGEPDTDLPPLDATQSIARFGFDTLCLCKGPNYQAEAAGKATGPAKFVRVEHGDSGTTILKRETPEMTVGDVLQQTIKKRGLRAVDYVLENKRYPGRQLDNAMKLTTLESTSSNASLEFLLIRKHSKRKTERPGEDALAAGQGIAQLEMYQPKTYNLQRLLRMGHQSVEMVISAEKVTVTPQGKTLFANSKAFLGSTKRATMVIAMEHIVGCERPAAGTSTAAGASAHQNKPAVFLLIHCANRDNIDFKTLTYEAKSASEAAEIVTKIGAILKYLVSDEHGRLAAAYARKLAHTTGTRL